MIRYSIEGFGVGFIFRFHGSVFPKAFCWSIPNAALTALLHTFFHEDTGENSPTAGVSILWSGYTVVLGFMIVFLTNQAYSRFWEGATLINQVRGTWFNAISNLVAFCTAEEELKEDVDGFQHTIVRLASLLYCSALQQICDLPDDTLEIIEVESIDRESRDYLQGVNDRCEILLQWMQRMIVEAHSGGVLSVAPPIISRVFQELSNGIVDLNNVRKIKEIPFPFPYAQLMTCLLLVHFVITPILACQAIRSRVWASVMCFFVTSSLWSLLYIAHQIDQPFGADDNDLPIAAMQCDFNRSLLQLLDPLAQKPPSYISSKKKPDRESLQMPVTVASTTCLETNVKPKERRPSWFAISPFASPRNSFSQSNQADANGTRAEIQRVAAAMEAVRSSTNTLGIPGVPEDAGRKTSASSSSSSSSSSNSRASNDDSDSCASLPADQQTQSRESRGGGPHVVLTTSIPLPMDPRGPARAKSNPNMTSIVPAVGPLQLPSAGPSEGGFGSKSSRATFS